MTDCHRTVALRDAPLALIASPSCGYPQSALLCVALVCVLATAFVVVKFLVPTQSPSVPTSCSMSPSAPTSCAPPASFIEHAKILETRLDKANFDIMKAVAVEVLGSSIGNPTRALTKSYLIAARTTKDSHLKELFEFEKEGGHVELINFFVASKAKHFLFGT